MIYPLFDDHWKLIVAPNFCLLTRETSNFSYLLISNFVQLCKVWAKWDKLDIWHFIRDPPLKFGWNNRRMRSQLTGFRVSKGPSMYYAITFFGIPPSPYEWLRNIWMAYNLVWCISWENANWSHRFWTTVCAPL